MSTWIMIGLLLIYLVLTGVCLFEAKLILALYWFGASILNAAVLLMELLK